MLTIEGKSVGSKKKLFDEWSIPVPPQSEGGITLRDLIGYVVDSEVEAFKDRQQERQLIQALSSSQIAEAVEKGKVSTGQSEVTPQPVDTNQAIETAIQAFADGIYLVALDDEQIENLDARLILKPDSRLTFIRLVLLAGG